MMQAIDASLCSRIGISTQRIEEPGLVKAPAPVLVGIGEYQYKIAGHIEPLYNLLTPGSAFFYFFREEIIDKLGPDTEASKKFQLPLSRIPRKASAFDYGVLVGLDHPLIAFIGQKSDVSGAQLRPDAVVVIGR